MPNSPDKKSLRAQKRAERERLNAAFCASASDKICIFLLEYVQKLAKKPQNIALYRAIRGEIDLSKAALALELAGYTLCLPVVLPSERCLAFAEFHSKMPLIKGTYGIETPHEKAKIISPDVVVVPLVAFDGLGHRLGYGAGHYDATIEMLRQQKKGVHILGAAYSLQQVDNIPAEGHDEKLDAVVTEKGILKSG